MTTIELPSTLTADVTYEYDTPDVPDRYRYHIVLRFGDVEVCRWEWQADRDADERTEPDRVDVAQFIAGKLREVVAP